MTKVSKSCVIDVKEMCERCQSYVESARELCEGVREQRQRCHCVKGVKELCGKCQNCVKGGRQLCEVSECCVKGVRGV